MRHLILAPGLLVLGLLAFAMPARAGEWVENDGYRFRLPDHFVGIEQGALGGGATASLSLPGAGGSGLEIDVRAWGRDFGSSEQAVLVVTRLTLTGEAGAQLRQELDPQTLLLKLRQGMAQARSALGEAGLGVEDVHNIPLGAEHEAVEMCAVVRDPVQREQYVRTAIAGHEDSVYVIVLAGAAATRRLDDAAWAGVTTSMRLQPTGGILHFAKQRWPFLAGGLGLLLVLVLLLRARSAGRDARFGRPRAPPGGAEGGLSRSMDGLPTYASKDLYAPDPSFAPRPAGASPVVSVDPLPFEGAPVREPTPEVENPAPFPLNPVGAPAEAHERAAAFGGGASTAAAPARRPAPSLSDQIGDALGLGDPAPTPWGGAVPGGATKRKIPLSKVAPLDGRAVGAKPKVAPVDEEKPRIQRNHDFVS